MNTMNAAVFHGVGEIHLDQKPIPVARAGEAVLRVTLTTICGTDLHILRGEYPVERGLAIGHEAVGVIHELGEGVQGFEIGDRVLVGAITPCGQCRACLSGHASQCGHGGGYSSLVTHALPLSQIEDAYRLFGEHRDGVLKIALKP